MTRAEKASLAPLWTSCNFVSLSDDVVSAFFRHNRSKRILSLSQFCRL